MKIRLLLCHLRLSAFIFAYIRFFFGIPCIPVEELCLSHPAGKRNVFILPACPADISYVAFLRKGRPMSMKVLIVEPDWRFARMASAYLESHAHLVVQESRLDDALARAAHWRPDLAIVASELAEEGFLDLLQNAAPDNRPAVLLTGWLDRYDIAWRAWQKGGDELLMKPVFTTDELHEAIVTALENATLGAAAPRRRAVSA